MFQQPDDGFVSFGWALVALGLVFVLFPSPLASSARMPGAGDAAALIRAARIGALAVMVVGVIMALA